jgi:hypothetical protein
MYRRCKLNAALTVGKDGREKKREITQRARSKRRRVHEEIS